MARRLVLEEQQAVSHGTAFDLYDLTDTIPDAVHISIPRAKRGQRHRAGVRIHGLEHPPGESQIRNLYGLPVTSPERSIVDALEIGAQPEQVELAIDQALDRGSQLRAGSVSPLPIAAHGSARSSTTP